MYKTYLRRAGLVMTFFALVGSLFFSTTLSSTVLAAGEKYSFKDANTIIGSGGDFKNERDFKKEGNGTFVWSQRDCSTRLICINKKMVIDNTRKNAGDAGYSARLTSSSDIESPTRSDILISDPKAVGPNGGAPNDLLGPGDSEASCEDNSGPLAWFLCPVTTTLDTTINFLDKEIQQRLLIDKSTYDSDQINRVWATLRNVAFLILVPIMLVMVVGTAVGFGPFDAYTVKKALPRLFAAVIFIALSLPVCQFFINLANIAGTGILGLMTAPLTDGQLSLQGLYDSGGDWGLVLTGGLIFTGLAAAGQITIGILISYAFVAFLAFLIAYLVLLMRELVIIFLLVIAPLAILAWIFPGNDKPWKLWRGAFINLLIMFPLIMGLIAAGRIMAELIDTSQGNTAQFLLKITAYILPYFFIPATFKVAGGLFATVAGIANDRSRGVFDKNKKYRQGRQAEGWQKFKTGGGEGRFRQSTLMRRSGERLGAGARGAYGFGKRGKSRTDLIKRAAAADAQKDPIMNALQFSDDGVMAMAVSAGSEKQARKTLAKAWGDDSYEKKARIDAAIATANSVGINQTNSLAALDMMARNKSFSLSDTNADGSQAIETILDTADALSGVQRDANGNILKDTGNNALRENIMGGFEFNSRQAGRLDLGGHNYKTGKADLDAGWAKAGLSQHAQGTSASLQAFAKQAKADWKSGDITKRGSAAIRILEMQNMLPYATGSNQEIINELLRNDIGIDHTKGSVESQLARSLGPGVDPADLRGRARVYDQQDYGRGNSPLSGQPPQK